MQILDRGSLMIRTLPLGAIATNCYVVACKETQTAAVIDACAEENRIQQMLDSTPSKTAAMLLQTHAHIDHVAALGAMKAKTNAPIYIHQAEMPLYESAPMQGLMLGLTNVAPLPPPDIFVKDGDVIELGTHEARVVLLPGHTPGSVCYYFEESAVIFSGDVLFAGSIGRTDLPGGNYSVMLESLRKIRTFPEDTLVLSGHGPPTTIGREKKTNPFLLQLGV